MGKVTFALLLVVAVGIAAYQFTTQQLVSALIWFGLMVAGSIVIALTFPTPKNLLLTAATAIGMATLALMSSYLVDPKRDEYIVAAILGLLCSWIPAMLGIGGLVWLVITILTMRRRVMSADS